MNHGHLFALSNYLSHVITLGTADESTGCDHTFAHTLRWIRANHLDEETVLGWLQQRGGWCDCTVVQEVLMAVPGELGENAPVLPLSRFRAWPREV